MSDESLGDELFGWANVIADPHVDLNAAGNALADLARRVNAQVDDLSARLAVAEAAYTEAESARIAVREDAGHLADAVLDLIGSNKRAEAERDAELHRIDKIFIYIKMAGDSASIDEILSMLIDEE